MKSHRHIDRNYDERLSAIRDDVTQLGARVDALIASAARGLAEGDPALEQHTRAESAALDQLERAIDRTCMITLATRAPVASDLGVVMLAMKVSTELGRVADLAKHIGERAHESSSALADEDGRDVERMAELVREMWRDALAAYTGSDAARAAAVVAREGEVDALYARMFDRTVALMSRDAESVQTGVLVQSVAKRLERMADHACRAADAVLAFLDGDASREASELVPHDG